MAYKDLYQMSDSPGRSSYTLHLPGQKTRPALSKAVQGREMSRAGPRKGLGSSPGSDTELSVILLYLSEWHRVGTPALVVPKLSSSPQPHVKSSLKT